MALCEHPYWSSENNIWCPCGKCPVCRKKNANSWRLRIIHEASYHSSSCFVTLTYDNDHLPADYGLRYVDCQNFWKRLRKHLDYSIRYFICGEYGEKTQRPHYHAVIFGLRNSLGNDPDCPDESFMHELIKSCWNNGEVYLGWSVGNECAAYVSSYVLKKQRQSYYGSRAAPFVRCSLGIGKQYALDHSAELISCNYIKSSGVKYPVPRYYYKQILPEGVTVAETLGDRLDEFNLQLLNTLIAHAGDEDIFVTPDSDFWDKYDYLHFKNNGYILTIGDVDYILNEAGYNLLCRIRKQTNDNIRSKLRLKERM